MSNHYILLNSFPNLQILYFSHFGQKVLRSLFEIKFKIETDSPKKASKIKAKLLIPPASSKQAKTDRDSKWFLQS